MSRVRHWRWNNFNNESRTWFIAFCSIKMMTVYSCLDFHFASNPIAEISHPQISLSTNLDAFAREFYSTVQSSLVECRSICSQDFHIDYVPQLRIVFPGKCCNHSIPVWGPSLPQTQWPGYSLRKLPSAFFMWLFTFQMAEIPGQRPGWRSFSEILGHSSSEFCPQ